VTYASQIASEYGYQVKAKALPLDVVAFSCASKRKIVVNSKLPEFRQNFGILHELAHIQLKHKSPYSEDMENEADELAAELLLPTSFIGNETDLHVLKEKYPYVSYEFLARRLADRGHLVAVYDNGQLKTKNGLLNGYQGRLVKQAFLDHCDVEGNDVTAFYVPPNGTWERVILVCQHQIETSDNA